ncbi:hypothetical protein F4778DRAFT_738756 [Xylariomycetidae sp. FL2044]|nr:hypothetical protein F4778DRAFT_738756 [Xylariomycetidae sp. FL2044]
MLPHGRPGTWRDDDPRYEWRWNERFGARVESYPTHLKPPYRPSCNHPKKTAQGFDRAGRLFALLSCRGGQKQSNTGCLVLLTTCSGSRRKADVNCSAANRYFEQIFCPWCLRLYSRFLLPPHPYTTRMLSVQQNIDHISLRYSSAMGYGARRRRCDARGEGVGHERKHSRTIGQYHSVGS